MTYCKTCNIFINEICTAGYKNPTTDVDPAINQAKHKGEWPCSFAPHRGAFIDKYRPGMKVRIVKDD